MQELDFGVHVRGAVRKSFFVFCIALLAVAADGGNPLFAGFAFGVLVSIVSGILLAVRIARLGEMKEVLDSAEERKKARWGAQMAVGALRWLFVISMLVFAVKTGWFNLLAVLGGLFVLPAFAVGGGLKVLLGYRKDLHKCNSF
ncbi:ATP synthase subunit I [Desulforudis sp. 1088]|uniref:ATP synthase subunit I n=1 Tax=unclassified Candidatus Desulforudis TaxID=2635950 RepID=UPI003479A026